MKNLGVYVHIPFCISRCAYCDFVSSVLKYDASIHTYVEHLTKEIELLAQNGTFKDRVVNTIYFGGGTPSLLKTNYFRSILETLRLNSRVEPIEITFEANPATITLNELNELKSLEFNRISIGVQSLNDKTLKAINRRHNAAEAIEAIEMAEKTGLSISVDLMVGLPYQTKEDIKFFVDEVTKFKVNHVSVYMLSLEDGTALKDQVDKNLITIASDDEKVELFDYAASLLKEKGFVRYEVSNFAKPGFEAKHNFKYWTRDEYIGLGLNAHSLINNKRFYDEGTFDKYYMAIDSGCLPHVKEADLDQNDIKEEYIMLRFRTNQGINFADYLEKFGKDFKEEHQKAIHLHEDKLYISNDSISIKEGYLNVLNQIVIDFI